jgi:hypothetical protein
MNYYKEAIKNDGYVLLLSKVKEQLKQEVLKEISMYEQSGYPCCVITYDEYCNYESEDIDRSSDLNLFSNINIKSFNSSQIFLSNFISCLLELNYGKPLIESEKDILNKICAEVDFEPEQVPLFEVLKLIQDRMKFHDILTQFSRKIDVTVETLKGNTVFFSECDDITILFTNLVNTLLNIKEDESGQRYYIYTDILDHIIDHPNVLGFLVDFISQLGPEKLCLYYSSTNPPSIPVKHDLHLSYIKILDSLENYTNIKKNFYIMPWHWSTCKVIKLKEKTNLIL